MGRTRLVAVLFTDVVGSTSWRSSVGDAVADRLREPFDALLWETIAAHEGTVVKGLGDGLMATFPSATSAIEGAVALQRAVEVEHRSATSAGLDIRVGLSVGDVHDHDDDVHGMPVVEAARLCDAAGTGRILCRDTVRLLAGSRVEAGFLPAGELALKGLPEPLPAYEVVWEPAGSPVPLPPPLIREEQFAFVGRQAERARILDAWDETTAGARRAFFIAGEPGVGKTRLVSEVASGLHEAGAVVLFGRCDEGLGVPFQPFAEALRHYLDHVDAPALGRFGGDLTRLVPELHERVEGLAPPLRSDPDTERHRLFEAVALWLAAASERDPILLVLDDLQWATSPTIGLLRHVLSCSHPQRLLVVATYRDSDLGSSMAIGDALGELLRARGSAVVELAGLSTDDVGHFLSVAAGRDLDDDGSRLAGAIHDTTGGNAFFVSEVLRNLVESGAVVRRDGEWVAPGPVEDVKIPLGVREVVRRRLSRLDELANQALAVGATIGQEFAARVLFAAGGFDLAAVEPALSAATAARIIEEVPGPTIAYRFSHALARTTIYEDLSALRRAVLHRRVAEAIEEVDGGNVHQASDLALHYSAAAVDGDVAKAIEWSTIAGRDAADRLAFSEALSHLERALELRRAAGMAADGEACDLMIEVGRAQWALGDPRERATLLDAARMATGLGDTGRAARALLADQRGMGGTIGTADPDRIRAIEGVLDAMEDDEGIDRALLTSELALALVYTPGTDERRRALAEEAVAMARLLGSPETLATTLHDYWLTIWGPGTVGDRHRAYEELDRLGEGIDDPIWHALAQPRRIVHAVECCDLDRAWRLSEAFDATAEALGLPLVRWTAGVHRAGLLEMTGDLDGAVQAAEEAFVHGTDAGQPDAVLFHSALTGIVTMWRDDHRTLVESLESIHSVFPDVPGLTPFLALMLVRAGRRDDGLALVRDELAAPSRMSRDGTTLTGWAVLADIAGLTGSSEHAPALLEALWPTRDTVVGNGIVWNESGAVRVGLVQVLLGDWAGAEASFDVADDIARRLRAPLWQAIAATERAKLHARRGEPGDRDRCLALLDEAADLAEPRGALLLRHRGDLVRDELGR